MSDERRPPKDLTEAGGFLNGKVTPITVAKEAREKKARKQKDEKTKSIIPAESRLTDAGNAELLAKLHGADIRFSKPRGGWFVWCGTHWVPDTTKEIDRRAATVPHALWHEAAASGDATVSSDGLPVAEIVKWGVDCRSRKRHGAMIEMAEHQPGIAVAHDAFDSDPWLLNVQNGTLDLRTCQLRAHRREDLMTSCAPTHYDPNARAPRFERFLEEALPDPDVRAFVQRFVGYALTGIVREHVLVIFYGELGRNGKGTLLRTLEAVLGRGHVRRVSNDLVIVNKGGTPHPTIRFTLVGSRLAYFAETADGAQFNTSELKDLTGGDVFNARRMRQDDHAYRPSHKLLLQTNRRPKADASDQAFWARVRLVEWPVSFEGREDHTLEPAIQGDGARDIGERAGVLRWAVEGCAEWQRIGLAAPAKVLEATQTYRAGEDVIGRFLAERTRPIAPHIGAKTTVNDLFKAFTTWCSESLERPLNAVHFGRALRRHGLKDGPKANGYPTIRHIALIANAEEEGN